MTHPRDTPRNHAHVTHLLGRRLLVAPVPDHDVRALPAEPRHDPLEAAFLAWKNRPTQLPYRLMYKTHPKIWSYFVVLRFIKNIVNSYSCIRRTPSFDVQFWGKKVLHTRWYGTPENKKLNTGASPAQSPPSDWDSFFVVPLNTQWRWGGGGGETPV